MTWAATKRYLSLSVAELLRVAATAVATPLVADVAAEFWAVCSDDSAAKARAVVVADRAVARLVALPAVRPAVAVAEATAAADVLQSLFAQQFATRRSGARTLFANKFLAPPIKLSAAKSRTPTRSPSTRAKRKRVWFLSLGLVPKLVHVRST